VNFFSIIAKTNNHMPIPLSAVIPAAGSSGRMGRDKALLVNGNGVTFARHLVNCFSIYGCNPIVMVVNEKYDQASFQAKNLVTIVNLQPEKGRSWSVLLGLKNVPMGNACFIQNIDNPFLEPGLLDRLVESVPPDGYAVPVHHGHGGHPILLGNSVVDFFRVQPELHDFRLDLQRFTRIEVPYPDEGILWNINTPAEYKQFARGDRQSDKKL
jgi:CTP:molybdopterin cytidylyltransferase MocA